MLNPTYAPPILQARNRDPRLRYFQALAEQGASTAPVQSPLEAFARVAQAGIGGYLGGRVNQEYDDRQRRYQEALSQAMATADPIAALQAAGNADVLSQFGPQILSAKTRAAERSEEQAARAVRTLTAAEMSALGLPAGTVAQTDQSGRISIVNKPDKPEKAAEAPAAIREYEYAKANGYRGTFEQWKKVEKEGSGGPFTGTSMEAQFLNVLLKGDPTSAEYRAAYNQMSQPKVQINPQTGSLVSVQPDMSGFRPPAGVRPSGEPTRPEAGARPMPQPSGQPSRIPTTQQIGSSLVTTQPGADVKGMQDFQKSQISANQMLFALDDFVKTFEGADALTKARSVMGMNTPLNTAFANAALLSKGEELYNLGVLNGPDLEIIRRTIADPSTLQGAITNPAELTQSVAKIKALIQKRLNDRAAQLGVSQPNTSGWSIQKVP